MAEEFFAKLIASAIVDFRIPADRRHQFRESVNGMREGLSLDSRIKASSDVLCVMRDYAEAGMHACPNPNDESIEAYASHTADLCIALNLVLNSPAVKENVSWYRQHQWH